jgi:hypothetical protein
MPLHNNLSHNIVLQHRMMVLLWNGSKLKFYNIGSKCYPTDKASKVYWGLYYKTSVYLSPLAN